MGVFSDISASSLPRDTAAISRSLKFALFFQFCGKIPKVSICENMEITKTEEKLQFMTDNKSSAISPIAVIGPTGIGKSALALDLAEKFNAEIVNCDAMQQYRGMDIGTAKTPVEERRGIPHHQIDVLDVTETATVARYQSRDRRYRRTLEKGRFPLLSVDQCSTFSHF